MRGHGVGLWPPPARPERGTRCIPLTRTAGGCGGGGWVEQTEFSVEGAREVVNKERADSLLKPLLAAGAAFTMVRRLQGGQPLRPAGWRRSASPLAAVAVQTVERFRGGAWGVGGWQVKLSTKSFGAGSAEVAAAALANNARTLQHADLSDIIAGRPVRPCASSHAAGASSSCGSRINEDSVANGAGTCSKAVVSRW
jgi:hypothetical protein